MTQATDAVDRRTALKPLEVQVAVLIEKVDTLNLAVIDMKCQHAIQTEAISKLSDQWNNAQGALNLAKWVAGIVTAAGIWTAAAKAHIFGH